MVETRGMEKAPVAPQLFGNAGREHMEKYGTKLEHFAKIAEKNHRHSAQVRSAVVRLAVQIAVPVLCDISTLSLSQIASVLTCGICGNVPCDRTRVRSSETCTRWSRL